MIKSRSTNLDISVIEILSAREVNVDYRRTLTSEPSDQMQSTSSP